MKNQRIILGIILGVAVVLVWGGQALVHAGVPAFNPPIRCIDTSDSTYACLDSHDPNGPTYQFQDIALNNAALPFGNMDDGVVHVTMPFSYTLYDLTSDKLTVSTNGVVKFGSHIGAINAFNTGLGATSGYAYYIAPFWDDLDNSPGIPGMNGGVYTDVVGTAPNRQFIIQWHNMQHYNNTGLSTFQMILPENSTELVFQYQDVVFDVLNFDNGASATVGIRGSDSWVQYSYNEAVVMDGTAIQFFLSNATPPTAVTDSYVVEHRQQLSTTTSILDNDSPASGLQAALFSDVSYGTLDLRPDGTFTYMPNHNFAGFDNFIYYANDGTSNSSVQVVSIQVRNKVPVVAADAYTTTLTSPIVMAADGVLANDRDNDGDVITATLDVDVSHGSLTFSTDGSFTYVADSGFVGTDSFTYRASDGMSHSAGVEVSLVVKPTYTFLPVIIR